MTKKSTKIGRATTPQKKFPRWNQYRYIYICIFFLIYKKKAKKIQIHYCVLICRILIEDYVINMFFFVGRGGRKEKWAYGYTKPIANFLFRSTKLFWVSHYPPSSPIITIKKKANNITRVCAGVLYTDYHFWFVDLKKFIIKKYQSVHSMFPLLSFSPFFFHHLFF